MVMAFFQVTDMIKAIFFDCDGTLLSHRTNTVPASTIRALNLLRRKGILAVLSTGRHKSELRELTPLAPLSFDAFITVNGACTYTDTEVLSSVPISQRDAHAVYRFLQDHDLPVQCFLEEDSFINTVNETVIHSQAMIHTPVPPIGDIRRILEEPVYLMVPFGIAAAQSLVQTLQDVAVTRWNAHDAMDVVNRNAGKEQGMKAVMEHYGIQREETMAFGDAMNDHTMLEAAGIGIAMGNSDREILELADYVTTDIEEDGIWNALKAFHVIDEEDER